MARTSLTTDDLRRLETAATADLREVLGMPREGEVLNLTGLEFLAFLGAKIALPIACGFVSRFLYEKYRDLKKPSIEVARKELANADLDRRDPVLEEFLRRDQMGILVAEGISEEQATRIVDQAMRRLKDRLAR